MLAIKDGKVVGIVNDDVRIIEEGGVIKKENKEYRQYECTHCQTKLIKEMAIFQYDGQIVCLEGMNVKYARTENGKCEGCVFENYEFSSNVCITACKPNYKFELAE